MLVNYENREDLSQNIKLPTWQNHPAWSASLKIGSDIIIEGDEPWFGESQEATSRGYFLIGVHSYASATFAITATTVTHNSLREDGTNATSLEIEQLYLGVQETDAIVAPNETRYFSL